MPKITLELMINCNNGYFVFTRESPPMLSGIAWHAGMLFNDGDCNEPYKVASVTVDKYGSVVVAFTEKDTRNTEDFPLYEVNLLKKCGWELTEEG